MTPADALAERKARLVAQSDLQRMQAMLAWHTARGIMSPPPGAERSATSRSIATTMIGIALPLFGLRKVRGTMRMLTLAATALRLFQAWRKR